MYGTLGTVGQTVVFYVAAECKKEEELKNKRHSIMVKNVKVHLLKKSSATENAQTVQVVKS